jgi:glutaredoxin
VKNNQAIKSAVLLIILMLFSINILAEVFKTVDGKGKVVYSSRKSDQNANSMQLNLPKNSPVPSTSTAQKPKVILFATKWCGFCKKERAFLRKHYIDFEEINTETPDGSKQFKAIGGIGVPVTLIDDQRLDGYDENRLQQLLKLDM